MTLSLELSLLWAGLTCYAAAASAALGRILGGRGASRWLPWTLGLGVLFLALANAERWRRVGHGPFITLFEILLSSLFTLGLLYLIAYWRVPRIRPGLITALPVLVLLGLWVVQVPREPTRLPPTYDNPWLWVHVTVGKVFLAAALVSFSLASLLLMRRLPAVRAWADRQVPPQQLDSLAWRFIMLALVFHSLMLIAGALWAQDAWGRYWAWDPLETWAFLTWLAMVGALHARLAVSVPPRMGWWMLVGVFALAFVTFFGVPFLSQVPHQGAI